MLRNIENASLMDRRLVEVSSMFYEQDLSKTEIANSQNISITHVNRLLREARQKGIVQIDIRSPRFERIESQLISHLGLRDAHVIQSTDKQDVLRLELGREAALYFDRCVSDGARVGVSSGRTIFEMASLISERSRKISIFPLNVILERDLLVRGLSANIVATILWFRSRPLATASRVEMFFPAGDLATLRKMSTEILETPAVQALATQIRDLDAYFIGAGELREGSQVDFLSKTCGIELSSLIQRGVVGDVAFNMLNAEGSPIRVGLDDLLFHVKTEDLRAAAASAKRTVVLVAGGSEKIPCVEAAIRGKLFNVLITDSETAQEILDSD